MRLTLYVIQSFWNDKQEWIWFRSWYLNLLQVLKTHTRGCGVTLGTTPIFHLIFYIVPYMNIYGLGVGDPSDFPYISFDLLYCPIHEYIWLRGGDLICFQVIKQDWVGWPLGVSLYFIWFVLLSHTWMYMVERWGSHPFQSYQSYQTGGGRVPQRTPHTYCDVFDR